jgi:hypothetical protein
MLDDRFALSDLEGKSVNIDTELTSTTIRAINLVSSSLFLDPHELKRQNLLLQNIDRY